MSSATDGNALADLLDPALKQCWELLGRDCAVTIYPRPRYCNRGNFHALFDGRSAIISGADNWPRYYFDLQRAMAELAALLEKRQLLIQTNCWTHYLLDSIGNRTHSETVNIEGGHAP